MKPETEAFWHALFLLVLLILCNVGYFWVRT